MTPRRRHIAAALSLTLGALLVRALPADKNAPPRPLAPKAVAKLVKNAEAVIVDVREGEERREVVPGARWMPMSRAQDDKAWAGFVAELPKGKTVVFHCAAGIRAKRAAEKLSAQGFKTAYFESPDQWKAQGLSVEKGPAD